MKVRYLLLAALVGVAGTIGVTQAIGASPSDKNVLFSTMLGKKEVNPTTGKKGAGDKNGRGGATVVIDGDTLCIGITVRNIGDPTAAHIHRGRSSVAGPVVVPESGASFDVPNSGDPGASSDCVTVSDASLRKQIQKNPSKFYVNVHNADFPGGAVRGQLFARRK